MLIQFLFTNIHFVLTLFTTLVFFTTGWLYFDSWLITKEKKSVLLRSAGFFILVLASATHATQIADINFMVLRDVVKLTGLIFILSSLFFEPFLEPPARLHAFLPFFSAASLPTTVGLTFFVSITYFFKAGPGFEKQLKPAAVAFFFFFVSDLISLLSIWSVTPVVFWTELLGDFGPIWVASHVFEFIGASVLGIWAWGYLRFRPAPQLFIILSASSFFIFAAMTFLLNFFLLKNLEHDFLNHLKTDVKLLEYATDRIKNEALANAISIAGSSELQKSLTNANREELFTITSSLLERQNLDFLTVIAPSGEVLMRAEDKDKVGDTQIDDPFIRSALAGQRVSTILNEEGVFAPTVEVFSAVPVLETGTGNILGVVSTGFIVDNAFVDGVKAVTNLDISVFAKDVRAATTFLAPDGKSRFVGTRESNPTIIETVLMKNTMFVGKTSLFNEQYYAAYIPIRSFEDNVVGMLFVGKPQIHLFETAEKSIQLTYVGSVLLLLISLVPVYFVSSYMRKNLEA